MPLEGIPSIHLMAEKHQQVPSRAMERGLSSPLQTKGNTYRVGSLPVALSAAFILVLSILCGTSLGAQKVPVFFLEKVIPFPCLALSWLSPPFTCEGIKFWGFSFLQYSHCPMIHQLLNMEFHHFSVRKNTDKSQGGQWVLTYCWFCFFLFFFNSELRK